MFEFTGNNPWDNAAEGPVEPRSSIRLSEIISALSYALDLTEGQPIGHAIRSCMIGMRLAQQIGVIRARQLPIRALDLLGARRWPYLERRVVVLHDPLMGMTSDE